MKLISCYSFVHDSYTHTHAHFYTFTYGISTFLLVHSLVRFLHIMAWNHSLVNFVTFKKNEDFLVIGYRFTLQQHYFSFVDGLKVKAPHFFLDSSHTLCSIIMCSRFISLLLLLLGTQCCILYIIWCCY